MNLRAIDISKVAGAPELWQEIVEASPDGWIWHTWLAHEFNLCAGEKFKATDHSFFVYENGKAVGVVPLIIQEKSIGDFVGREATYYSGFLPWPCFAENTGQEAHEDFAFAELERRARGAGAGHIRMLLAPPHNTGDEGECIERVASTHHYLHSSSHSQVVRIDADALSRVRTRSRQYYKKHAPLFSLDVAEGAVVTPELEETYFRLHVKDAGGQFRSRESYTKQADIARKGEGFYVVVTEKKSGVVAGMALISVYHGAAMDSSVAVDPAFKDKRVGHLVKWRAIEELMKRGIATYEVGHQKLNIPTFQKLVTKKDIGISEFKEGWTRGNGRTIWEIEKFLDAKFLHAYFESREASLKEYFKL